MSNLFEQLQATLGAAYRLERELGGGGMSRVFLAQEVALGRNVVIKVLLPELAAGVSVDRFRREIQFAAQLQHPHIVPLLSAGEANGLPFFTMPFISGESLAVKLARSGELPVSETVRILRDVASALAYAHGEGVMHRDVKPGNVLMSGGVAVVTDFGVAKALSVSADSTASHLTSLGVALGTPAYMAPEQASGDPQVDHRADIYALGVVTYEMLAGRTPFWGRATSAVLAAHVVEAPEPIDRLRPGMPAMLADLVMRCLEKRPADRPQSAGEMMNVLDAISTPTGGTASTTVVLKPSTQSHPVHRRPAAIALVAGAAAVLAGVLLWSRLTSRPTPPGEEARHRPEQATMAPDSGAPAATPAPAGQGMAPFPQAESAAPPADTTTPSPRQADGQPGAREPAARPRTAGAPTTERKTARPPSAKTREAAPRADTVPSPASESGGAAAPGATRLPSRDTAGRRPGGEQARPESLSPRAPGPPAATPPATARESAVAGAVQPPAPQPTPPSPAPAPPPTPGPQPAADPTPEIRSVLAAYGPAVESENVENIRRLYPGMTPDQERSWKQFFETVRDVKAQLSVASLQVTNNAAEAQMTGTYIYQNNSTRETEQQRIAFHVSLRRDPTGWRITQVR